MIIFLFTVGWGSRSSFSIVLIQMVLIPNLNQTTNSNHENICPANAIQEANQKNQTSSVSDETIAVTVVQYNKSKLYLLFLDA